MSMNATLNSQRVSAIFYDCLYGDLSVYGALGKHVWLDSERLQGYKAEIEAMLGELPDEFKESGGGGWSFLNARNDKHGNQWTGFQNVMEQLFLLGIGIGKVKSMFPGKIWDDLPGRMPYYIVLNESNTRARQVA